MPDQCLENILGMLQLFLNRYGLDGARGHAAHARDAVLHFGYDHPVHRLAVDAPRAHLDARLAVDTLAVVYLDFVQYGSLAFTDAAAKIIRVAVWGRGYMARSAGFR